MVGFSKYCLLVLTAVTLVIPSYLAAQAKQATPKTGSRDEQAKHSATQKSESHGEAGNFLHKDWQVQSSCDDKAGGDKIS